MRYVLHYIITREFHIDNDQEMADPLTYTNEPQELNGTCII